MCKIAQTVIAGETRLGFQCSLEGSVAACMFCALSVAQRSPNMGTAQHMAGYQEHYIMNGWGREGGAGRFGNSSSNQHGQGTLDAFELAEAQVAKTSTYSYLKKISSCCWQYCSQNGCWSISFKTIPMVTMVNVKIGRAVSCRPPSEMSFTYGLEAIQRTCILCQRHHTFRTHRSSMLGWSNPT